MKISKNKVLITGATVGIGKALMDAFLAQGNQVIAVARNEQKLTELAAQNPHIIPFACDLARNEDLDRLAVFIEQEHKDLNVLLNNAGIQYNYHFMQETQLLAKIDREIQVNFTAPLKLIGLLLPTIALNPDAAIVNVSSGLGLVPKMAAPVYCGTKAGIHIFSQSLRYQLETEEVAVFEIIPPLVDTEMTAGRGSGKISPQELADEFMRAWQKDRKEVSIGKVKLLKIIQRFFPSIAARIMKGEM